MQLQSHHTSKATNILTCLILPYTALQNKHVLTCGDYISGVEGTPHVQNQSVRKFLCGINGCRSTPHHRMSGFWCPMRRKIYTFGRRPATRQHVAEERYPSVRRHKTSNSDTLPFPYLQRSGGAKLYQNVRRQNMNARINPQLLVWNNLLYDVIPSSKGITTNLYGRTNNMAAFDLRWMFSDFYFMVRLLVHFPEEGSIFM